MAEKSASDGKNEDVVPGSVVIFEGVAASEGLEGEVTQVGVGYVHK